MKLAISVLKDRGLVILVAVILTVGLIGHFYIEANEQTFITKNFSNTDIHCSDYEKHGSKALFLKTQEFGTLSTITRIKECMSRSGEHLSAKVYFSPQSRAIYGLELNEETVLEKKRSLESSRESLWILYFCISLIVIAAYVEHKKRKSNQR